MADMTGPVGAAAPAPQGRKGMASRSRRAPMPIVALDVPTLAEARAMVERLGEQADFYKVGLQLYTREGPQVVSWLRSQAKRVFLDLKLHDIPNTVRGAAGSAAAIGVELLTVHGIGGPAMLAAAVDGAGGPDAATKIVAVTVLTSFDERTYAEAIGGPPVAVREVVLRLAGIAAATGVRGVVCAGAEAGAVTEAFGGALGSLVPGLRPEGAATHDQARTSTPREAVAAGATWVVVGRAVTAAPDPAAAYAQIAAALAG